VFGWFIVVPAALKFLVNYNSSVVHYFPRASDYIHFVAYTELAMGIVFELPVVMMMLGRVGILRSSMMKRRWREAVVVLAVVAAALPGTDPVTMTAEYLPMLLLYWISYFLVKAVEPKRGISDILSEPFA
jgi:sec-independent protein translocase protein TatC